MNLLYDLSRNIFDLFFMSNVTAASVQDSSEQIWSLDVKFLRLKGKAALFQD